MNGWLVKVTLLGTEPDTRPLIETWAVWIADAVDAIAAVEKHTGATSPPAETIHILAESQLRGIGLSKNGEIRRLHAVL